MHYDKEKIEKLKAYIGERIVVAAISGGKDSTAMALFLKELDIPFQSVFIDTKWEHPATIEYIKHYLPNHIGSIKTLSESGGLIGLIRKKELFPLMNFRFCTGDLKIRPVTKYLATFDADIVNAVGIRGQESKERAMMAEWEYNDKMDCEVWRPLIDWKEEDVIAIHKRHNILPNPLYLLGANRVGCFPCMFAAKRDIRILIRETPERIDQIRRLEREINIRRRRKNPKAKLISWFYRGGKYYPIDEVVKWATDSTDNVELFTAQDHHKGCMKWGLCDIPNPIENQKQQVQETRIKKSTNKTY